MVSAWSCSKVHCQCTLSSPKQHAQDIAEPFRAYVHRGGEPGVERGYCETVDVRAFVNRIRQNEGDAQSVSRRTTGHSATRTHRSMSLGRSRASTVRLLKGQYRQIQPYRHQSSIMTGSALAVCSVKPGP